MHSLLRQPLLVHLTEAPDELDEPGHGMHALGLPWHSWWDRVEVFVKTRGQTPLHIGLALKQGLPRSLELRPQAPVLLRQKSCQEGCCDLEVVWLSLLQQRCYAALLAL